MKHTIKELDSAINLFLGKDVADAMRAARIPRPMLHDRAMITAFLNWPFTSPEEFDAANILRSFGNYLKNVGEYPNDGI